MLLASSAALPRAVALEVPAHAIGEDVHGRQPVLLLAEVDLRDALESGQRHQAAEDRSDANLGAHTWQQ